MSLNQEKPTFILSLDLELGWGFYSNPQSEILAELRRKPDEYISAVRKLLEQLDEYDIPATWGTVGHLLLNEKGKFIHRDLPQFQEGLIEWERYQEKCSTPLYRAPDVVKSILAAEMEHEIATHGFFHLPFTNCSEEVADLELKLSKKAAKQFGVDIKSLIFPENKIDHLDVLRKNKIKFYRGQNRTNLSFLNYPGLKKVNVLINSLSFLPVSASKENKNIWKIPSSMEFYNTHFPNLVSKRAKTGINTAVITGNIFHLWLHPWALIIRGELIEELKEVLKLVNKLREKDKIQAKTMKGLIDTNP